MVSISSGCRYTGTLYTASNLATPQKWSKWPCVSRMASGVRPCSLKKASNWSTSSDADMPGSTTVHACRPSFHSTTQLVPSGLKGNILECNIFTFQLALQIYDNFTNFVE